MRCLGTVLLPSLQAYKKAFIDMLSIKKPAITKVTVRTQQGFTDGIKSLENLSLETIDRSLDENYQ